MMMIAVRIERIAACLGSGDYVIRRSGDDIAVVGPVGNTVVDVVKVTGDGEAGKDTLIYRRGISREACEQLACEALHAPILDD